MAQNNAVRSKATAKINCDLNLTFADGSQKRKYIQEGDIVKNLTYKTKDGYKTIDGIVDVINFSSELSDSEGINEQNLANSKSVFSKV